MSLYLVFAGPNLLVRHSAAPPLRVLTSRSVHKTAQPLEIFPGLLHLTRRPEMLLADERACGPYRTQSAAAFGAVMRNPNLRWLELAWTASVVGHYAYPDRRLRLRLRRRRRGGGRPHLPGAARSRRPGRTVRGSARRPFPRERVLLVTNASRIVLVAAAALGVFLDAAPAVVYVLAVAATIAYTPYRSAHAALTPSLARSPAELTAANAVAGGVYSLALFVGPALAGFLLAVASTGARVPSDRTPPRRIDGFLLLIKTASGRAPEGRARGTHDRV